ncbi:hypothetical protein SRHO_G00120240 [Serrasalmus rhombeus]
MGHVRMTGVIEHSVLPKLGNLSAHCGTDLNTLLPGLDLPQIMALRGHCRHLHFPPHTASLQLWLRSFSS